MAKREPAQEAMATCLDYAKIAYAVYFKGAGQYCEDPPGHMVDEWTVQKWESGTWYGDGFQGGIYQSDTDIVVGCKGTSPKSKTVLADLSADVRLFCRILPNQCSSAHAMVKAAKAIASGRRVSVTGHSLGGALAQVVAVWNGIPFVTFNAPPMRQAVHAAKVNLFKPMMMVRTLTSQAVGDTEGINFRIKGDVISAAWSGGGGHVGTLVDLDKTINSGAHGKGTIWQAVLETDWWNINPFEAL